MYYKPKAKSQHMKAPLTLTSTVNSLVVAILTVSGAIAEFVEVNTFFCPDALYMIEGTSDHHLLCTWRRETTKRQKTPFTLT